MLIVVDSLYMYVVKYMYNNCSNANNDFKQLLDEVFMICRIINVEVRVIRDIDNFAYHKNLVQ